MSCMELLLYLNLLWGTAEVGCEDFTIIIQISDCFIFILFWFSSDVNKVTGQSLSFLSISGFREKEKVILIFEIQKWTHLTHTFECSCRISIFNGIWEAEDVNVLLLCYGPLPPCHPTPPARFCLDESWILGRCSWKLCIDKDICTDPSSK